MTEFFEAHVLFSWLNLRVKILSLRWRTPLVINGMDERDWYSINLAQVYNRSNSVSWKVFIERLGLLKAFFKANLAPIDLREQGLSPTWNNLGEITPIGWDVIATAHFLRSKRCFITALDVVDAKLFSQHSDILRIHLIRLSAIIVGIAEDATCKWHKAMDLVCVKVLIRS